MTIQQLESFLQVAENLNFARAAEYLNITQSAVSRQIHALEEELNAKLFYRTTRTVALTPEGTIFLEHAKQILGQLKIATAKIQHHSNLQIQVLSIGCESELELDYLSGLLALCRDRIAEFHPHLRVIPHRSLLNLFYQGELEMLFGFQENFPIKNDMVFLPLGSAPLCWVLPAAHPCARRETLDVGAVTPERLIICSSYSISSRAIELQNRLAQQLSPEKIHISENPRVIHTLIRAGYGCSILPRWASQDPDIAYVPLRNVPALPYGLLYHRSAANPALKSLVEVARGSSKNTPSVR